MQSCYHMRRIVWPHFAIYIPHPGLSFVCRLLRISSGIPEDVCLYDATYEIILKHTTTNLFHTFFDHYVFLYLLKSQANL